MNGKGVTSIVRLPTGRFHLISILTAIFLVACTHIQVPAPASGTDAVLPTLPPSHIAVEASYSEAALCSALNNAVPRTISENPSGHDCLQWGVYKNGSVTCGGAQNNLSSTLNILFRLGQRCGVFGIGQASCGFDNDPAKRAAISVNAPVTWVGWHLEANPAFGLNIQDACKITVANINVTSMLQNKAQGAMDAMSGQVSNQIKSHTDITGLASNAWKTAGNPVKLRDGVWLNLAPQDIGVTSPDVEGGQISMSAALVAVPVIYFSPTAPQSSPEKPFPAAPSKIAPSSNFSVIVDGVASWDEINSQLTKTLVGKDYKWGPFSAEPTGARAYGGDGIAVIAIDFKGSVTGTAYLQAKPVFNQATNTIQLKDVDFTMATKSALGTVGGWLLSAGIPAYLEAQTYSLNAPLNKLGTTLSPLLNQKLSPNLTLTGTLADTPPVQVLGLFVQSYGVVVRTAASGTLTITGQ
ncbi:DUF4403 family protein [Paraburkholderia lycopersici]|uniref:DUF4403 family protein n=1 Tax=Paraburkholderia lycopersici TaxID=416944 RepID=A0A1G6LYT5_9BURK|nr:DUF4403 family protein [Paraburkholderia lycopersici]SDC48442.1 protein of unknown function [Paraburkholderia lycopersici]